MQTDEFKGAEDLIQGPPKTETRKADMPTPQQQEDADGMVDRHGRSFDPRIHEVDKNGDPKTTSDRRLKMKRGRALERGLRLIAQEEQHRAGSDTTGDQGANGPVGSNQGGGSVDGNRPGSDASDSRHRPGHPHLEVPGTGEGQAEAGALEAERIHDEGSAAAGVILAIITGLLVFFFGRRWQLKEQEREPLQDSLGKVLSRWGVATLPAELELTAMSGAYVGTRLTPEEVESLKRSFSEPFAGPARPSDETEEQVEPNGDRP